MKARRLGCALAAAIFAAALASCTPPVQEVVAMSSATAPIPPPAPRVERAPPRLSPNAVWDPGHWEWTGSQYRWATGHYVERPASRAVWHPGRWQQQGPNWVWIEGGWT